MHLNTAGPTVVFRELASSPRGVGSAGESQGRALCCEALAEQGFTVRERPFEYSEWPGRWATPVMGILLMAAGMIIAAAGAGRAGFSLGAGFLVAILATVGWTWALRRGVLTFPLLRRVGTNIEAVRGGESPKIWLVAHLDSKSQPIPMALRIAGVVASGAVWGALLVGWGATLLGDVQGTVFVTVGISAVVAALPLVLSFVGDHSNGALDNASGVASVLAANMRISSETPVGILITTAEELGLAGARAWVAGRDAVLVVNCDGVDDDGQLICMISRDVDNQIRDIIDVASERSGLRPLVRRVVPGVLVDAVAFGDAGWPAMTLSRGGWKSFARIHTRRDDLARMSGSGIEAAGRFIAAIVDSSIGQPGGRSSGLRSEN